jgi:hypothetical protein
MGMNIETFIDSTQDVVSAAALKRLFLSAVADEGYQNAVFARTNERGLVSLPWAEFPAGYVETYRSEGWDRKDPVVQRAHLARRPFRWSETSPRGGFTKEQKRFFEECRELGVHSGITIPIPGTGRDVDLISLSLRQREQAPPHRMPYLYA